MRNEQIKAAREEIQAKNKIIETMNNKIERSDERIVELSAAVTDLIARLEKRRRREDCTWSLQRKFSSTRNDMLRILRQLSRVKIAQNST